ncbi:MAG: hypothetical protein KGS60_07620 [Verrucomicrobia bacterium]|nr:hypothetical protein [Verrucomicrobiota bacterium]
MKPYSPSLAVRALTGVVAGLCLLPALPTLWSQDSEPDVSGKDSLALQYYPRYYYDNTSRLPVFTFFSGFKLDPKSLAQHLHFTDAEAKVVPAKVRPATPDEITEAWKNFGAAGTDSPPADQFWSVEPVRPLPVGKQWRVLVSEGLADASRKHKLTRSFSVSAGSVYPFTVPTLGAVYPIDEEPRVYISLSKELDESIKGLIANYVSVEPQPPNLVFQGNGQTINLFGKFEMATDYRVRVKAGLLAADGTELAEPIDQVVRFRPEDAYISLPEHEIAQPLAGLQEFEIRHGNIGKLEVRVKELRGDALIYALRGYRIYDPETTDWERGQRYPAFEMVPGPVILSRDIQNDGPMNRSQRAGLKWSEVLKGSRPAALYVSVEGNAGDYPGMPKQRVGAQSLIQITDLGLIWKRTGREALAYVFSLSSGQPVADAEIRLVNNENETLGIYRSNGDGVASFPLGGPNAASRWLVATKAEDRYATAFDPASDQGLSTWEFDVRQPYWGEPENRLRSYLFSDRGVYKPGETVHLKAITRMADGRALQVPAAGKGFTAKLLVDDSRGRNFVNREVTFNERGTLDVSFDLPQGALGTYEAKIDFEALVGKGPVYDGEAEDHYDRYAFHYFSVAEYRPDTFEIKLETRPAYGLEDKVEIPVQANYFRGKALSNALASWYANYEGSVFAPAGFESYRFGLAREDVKGNDAGEFDLGESGSGTLALDFIPREVLEQPVRVRTEVTVTDVNQQTLVRSADFLVHSSDFYAGLKLPGDWQEAGATISAEMLAVSHDGKALDRVIPGKLTVERRIYRTVKVQGSDETERYRNEEVFEPVASLDVKIGGGNGIPSTQGVPLKDPGQYRFTLETANTAGKPLVTQNWCYLWGKNDVYWAYRDGEAIELKPDKDAYTVGDKARIMVRSPILGKALITTERAGVTRQFIRELASKNEFVEIPLEAGDAPNVFVSAIVIRGSQNSPNQKFRDTDYKLGYCELAVAQPANKLDVVLEVPSGDVLPARQVDAAVTVRNASGQPVPGAEVTFYAVDEGVLSLTGYETPDPAHRFHEGYPLFVKTWHSLFNVLTEDPEQRPFGNKGLLIGGGGDGLTSLRDRARKNFRATAVWNGGLLTDAQGRATISFPAPENLTGFKVFAIALGDPQHYGTATARFQVNKPVIIEPALPAFANLGDELILQAVVHNTTRTPGRFEATLLADATVEFPSNRTQPQPIALGGAPGPREWRSTIDLAAGQSTALPIPVKFTQTGDAIWTWTVRELDAKADPRTDSVESRFEVGHPVPMLAETLSLRVEPGAETNLLASLGDRSLLKGYGRIDATISNSRMIDAMDALQYNLDYPYGCVEQTTSSTLPWLTMNSLEKVFPDLEVDPARKESAIRHGLNRLLSMQTSEGGLSYWPGGEQPTFWASAYGGMALALGAKQAHGLPGARLEALWTWLSSQVRDAEASQDPDILHQRCLALYTLALAGKAEPSYHETYFKMQGRLAPETRAVLALAILEGGDAAQRRLAEGLLGRNPDPKAPAHAVDWYGPALPVAARLMAWTQLDARSKQSDELLNQLLRLRKPHHGWGSTYANAWPLLALGRIADLEAPALAAISGKLEFGETASEVALAAKLNSRTANFAFDGDVSRNLLRWTSDARDPVYAHVRVSTRPATLSAQPKNAGFGIRRTYFQLAPDGAMKETSEFEVGDLVVVRLDLDIPGAEEEYLAIDDPLPSIFESVNPAFTGRGDRAEAAWTGQQLPVSFQEMRTDRTLFFSDYLAARDQYRVEYLARVVAAGEATAPPAKIEAMYQPQRHGLSATTRITGKLAGKGPGKVAAR